MDNSIVGRVKRALLAHSISKLLIRFNSQENRNSSGIYEADIGRRSSRGPAQGGRTAEAEAETAAAAVRAGPG
jgi:hypothetical protein